MDKLGTETRVYTDMQSLERLRVASTKDPEAAKKEVSREFEAMLMQIVLRSMRDANKALSSDLFGSNQMDFYEDIFDKQLSLLMSKNENGFANMIETNINNQFGVQQKHEEKPLQLPNNINKIDTTKASEKDIPFENKSISSLHFNTPEEFIKNLWASAKTAANFIGADPKILLAQAALETNWGRKIISSENQHSTHNLFNIKADSSWKNDATVKSTLEEKEGLMVKEKSSFRKYSSFTDSFMDYVSFLKTNTRYQEALNKASNPKEFIQALQDAGFATDSNYANKIWQIFSSSTFKNLTSDLR